MATNPKGHSNPPRPPGASLLAQKDATQAVATWATEIVNNPGEYPMFSETARQFGDKQLMIRVEWHTWSHRKGKLVHGIYRGATVYEITDPDSYIEYTLNTPGSAVAGDPEIGAYVARRKVQKARGRTPLKLPPKPAPKQLTRGRPALRSTPKPTPPPKPPSGPPVETTAQRIARRQARGKAEAEARQASAQSESQSPADSPAEPQQQWNEQEQAEQEGRQEVIPREIPEHPPAEPERQDEGDVEGERDSLYAHDDIDDRFLDITPDDEDMHAMQAEFAGDASTWHGIVSPFRRE